MIIVRTRYSKLPFKYKGNITIYFNDSGIFISASWIEDGVWDAHVVDLFFYDDIVSIEGIEEKSG